jgi:hypothetical protein
MHNTFSLILNYRIDYKKENKMQLAEAISKQKKDTSRDYKIQLGLFNMLLNSLPKPILEYDWKSISYTPYTTGWSYLGLYLKEDDPATIAVITGWLTSLFDDIKISKPQWSKYNHAASIEAMTTIDDKELRICVFCYRTGECKKVKIFKEVPEEITEAHVEEEYAIVCAGEELPEGAEIVEEK